MFLGSSGAGFSCDTTSAAAAQVLKLAPRERRIARYERTGDSLKLVDEAPVAAPKGGWVGIGLRCETYRTIGYVGEKPSSKSRRGLARSIWC